MLVRPSAIDPSTVHMCCPIREPATRRREMGPDGGCGFMNERPMVRMWWESKALEICGGAAGRGAC